MYDKINGKKSTILIIDPYQKLSQEQINKIWEICKPIANIEPSFPLVFGEPYYQPDFFDPCYNCGNNPKNNPNASGNCWCSLPSKNITY